MSTPVCRVCGYLSRGRRSPGNYRSAGRREYWCNHPYGKAKCAEVSYRAPGFIGYSKPGECELDSVKTSPRWCPLKGGE